MRSGILNNDCTNPEINTEKVMEDNKISCKRLTENIVGNCLQMPVAVNC